MAIIKCKMCGGDLNIIEGQSVCECEYCGTRQTVPMLDDEKKMNLFARANRLRFNSEFDKASGIYESIIADAQEEAEAYWGLVLCKYGIEYVDDPATGRKIPTCHRSSFDSVMQDSDFDLACEYADPIARKVYRQEAKQIEEIRKGILEVSSKEEPYDIFICYKETDENGDRTLDSVLAQDIYDALTDKGYRTFFARISLEDKLGQEYEPYIFAALNSAKIMLAVGTDYDYYNAVWVKNEWSRYLKLMVKDKEKHLIPCYKNLDAYDMPQEFAKLQAQDLGKVGAIQDLLRGIEKLLGGVAVQETKPEQTVVVKAEVSGVKSLLERAQIFLEDEEWNKAEDYFNRVLDIFPKCAESYLGLSLAECQCVSLDQAVEKSVEECFASKNMKKAEHFADGALKNRILIAKKLLKRRVAEHEEAKRIADGELRLQNKKRLLKIRQKNEPVTNCFISAGFSHMVGLRSNGTVAALQFTGNPQFSHGECDVSEWTDIVSISAGSIHTVGLRSNGTVLATRSSTNEDFYYGQGDVSDWTDIVSISTGRSHTVGLKSDGTVVATKYTGDEKNYVGQSDVSDWSDIVAISAGDFHTVGLRRDGTVIATKYTGNEKNYAGECDVSNWTDIVAISAGWLHTVGLRSDGTVVATNYTGDPNYYMGQCEVSDWTDIVAISAGGFCTVGLRSDGTVVSIGENERGQCDVSDWTDIVAISAGLNRTVGLCSNGTVLIAGADGATQYEVSNWKLFDCIESIKQDQKTAHEQYLLKEKLRREEEHKAEERRKEEILKAEKQRQEGARKVAERIKLVELRRSQGLCPYCGGKFKGLFKKVCSQCGKPKDY